MSLIIFFLREREWKLQDSKPVGPLDIEEGIFFFLNTPQLLLLSSDDYAITIVIELENVN